MTRIKTLLLVCAVAFPTAAVAQQHSGSVEDQLACTPDVYRLCAGDIPDEDAITACLQERKAQLSDGCKAVFSRPDPTPEKPAGQDN